MSNDLIAVLIYVVGFLLSIAAVVVIVSWNHKEEDEEIGDTVFNCIPFCLFWPPIILIILISAPFFFLSKFIKKGTCNG